MRSYRRRFCAHAGPAHHEGSFIGNLPTLRVIAGVEQTFSVVLRDQFENERDASKPEIFADDENIIVVTPSVPSGAPIDLAPEWDAVVHTAFSVFS